MGHRGNGPAAEVSEWTRGIGPPTLQGPIPSVDSGMNSDQARQIVLHPGIKIDRGRAGGRRAKSERRSPNSNSRRKPSSSHRARTGQRSSESMEKRVIVGIDVSKARLDIAERPGMKQWRVGNDEAGISELMQQLIQLKPKLIVLEASGGLETAVTGAIAAEGLPVVVVNPRQVRDFARASGRLAKTDRLDADGIAHFGEAINPSPRPLPDEETQLLNALWVRRRQLIGMLTAENNRLASAPRSIRQEIRQHITWLQKRLSRTDKDLDQAIRQSPVWREKDNLIQSVPGIGQTMSVTVCAALPELGRLTHKQITALVGIAPYAKDSGQMRGKRVICGGRSRVRSTLYMCALVAIRHNPVLKRFYEKLRLAGKPPKLAITACMRKLLIILNAIVKHRQPWQPDFCS